ncbi:MAG: InlB B-repeat-containing protein, partial [Alphaproteobacteria bacterium]|nr:InlB B-repeat-containing protein [Alphaproteobacteria bacterium]
MDSNKQCQQCPSGYPNSVDNNTGGITSCYKTVTASCTKKDGSIPGGCASVTAWNDCSCTGSTYKQYSNSAGTGNGTTSGTTAETCTKTARTVTAKTNYYVSGATCPACSGISSGTYPKSDGGNITSAYCYKDGTKTGNQVNGNTPTGCSNVTEWNTCTPGTCTYKDYYTATDTTCTPNNCTKTARTVTAKTNYYVSGATCPACSGISSGTYPKSDGGNITSAYCYKDGTKTGNQVNGNTPTGCSNVTEWNTCTPGTCTYKDYYTATDTTCTPNNCTKTAKTVTASANYYVSGATCPACSGVGNGSYTKSAGGSINSNSCYLTTTAGNYVATAGSGQTACTAGYYCPGGTTIYYGTGTTTGGRTSCPATTKTGYFVYNGSTVRTSAGGSSAATSCYLDRSKADYWTAQTGNHGFWRPQNTTDKCYYSSSTGYYDNCKNSSGSTIAKRFSECNAGYFIDTSKSQSGYTNTCTACATGSYTSASGINSDATTAMGNGSYVYETSCTACTGGKTNSGTANTSCSTSCTSISNLSTWVIPTWTNNTVSNLCKVATCVSGYTANTTQNTCTLTKYSITYYDGSTKYTTLTPTEYNITSADITLPTPTKTGYTFGGWYTESALTNKVTQIATGSIGNKTFYAKWTAKSITCAAGEYLPASSETCKECPVALYCSGGTWKYDGASHGTATCPKPTGVGTIGTWDGTKTTGATKIEHCIAYAVPFSLENGSGTRRCLYTSGSGTSAKYETSCHYPKFETCTTGYYMTKNGTYNGTPADQNECSACNSGYYCTGGTANKTSCPGTDGIWTLSQDNKTSCSGCAAVKTSLTNCSAGALKVWASNTNGTCTWDFGTQKITTTIKAKSGYYVNDASCSACAAGTYQPTDGSTTTSCTAADKGYYVSGAGASTQTACTGATYTDKTGQTSCTKCPTDTNATQLGYYTSDNIHNTKSGCQAQYVNAQPANSTITSGSYIWCYVDPDSNGGYADTYGLNGKGNGYGCRINSDNINCNAGYYANQSGTYATAKYDKNSKRIISNKLADLKKYACVAVDNGYYSPATSKDKYACSALSGVSVSGGKYTSISTRGASTDCQYTAPDKTIDGCASAKSNTVTYSGTAWPANTYSVTANTGHVISGNNSTAPSCPACVTGYSNTNPSATSCTPNTYTVTYACGTGATGTAPREETATYNATFTPAANTCAKT